MFNLEHFARSLSEAFLIFRSAFKVSMFVEIDVISVPKQQLFDSD